MRTPFHSFIAACAAVASMAAAEGAHAERSPRAVPADFRIRTVPFDKDNVVVLYGTMGISTMIVLGDDEKISTVAMGDSMSWQALPDQSKRYLFIKPLEPNAFTNMNIVTNKRIYNFVLKTGSMAGEKAVYKLRFTYPDEEASARLLSKAQAMAAWPNLQALRRENANFDYVYKGRVTNKPEVVFDDGLKTFFKFEGDVPGIFLVNMDKSETLVNYRREGQFIIVDKVAGQWTLRHGDEATCVFNLHAVSEPPPKTELTDVQPPMQAEHAPGDEDFFQRIFWSISR